MAYKRSAVRPFMLANAAYAGASVSFFTVDPLTLAKTTTLATVYDAPTGTGTLANPLTLDASGKFTTVGYVDERVIASVVTTGLGNHDTGIIEPSLSDADVAAVTALVGQATQQAVDAAQSAADAEQSEQDLLVLGGAQVTAAQNAATASANSAALAQAAVGGVRATLTDTTARPLSTKLQPAGRIVTRIKNLAGDEIMEMKERAAAVMSATSTFQVGGLQTVSSAGGSFLSYLPPIGAGDTALQDGDLIELLDLGNSIEANPVTISGNGKNIEFYGEIASTLQWIGPNGGRLWCVWDAAADRWKVSGV